MNSWKDIQEEDHAEEIPGDCFGQQTLKAENKI